MNKEIKFRAWDGSRIFNVARYDFADNTVYSHLFACEGYLGEKLEIMQYTGLNDKHGNPIFEGDIVVNTGMWTLHSTKHLQISRRRYEKGEMFVVHHNITGLELRHIDDWNANTKKKFAPNGYSGKPYVDNHDFWNLQKTLEVIGNIYSNPELLEESK